MSALLEQIFTGFSICKATQAWFCSRWLYFFSYQVSSIGTPNDSVYHHP